MKLPTIALAMIVKDEASNIRQCIESVAPWINEFRIVDTGSTDDTVKILEELKKEYKKPFEIVKINPETHPEYWVEVNGKKRIKFAKARNLSYKGIKSKWTLWLDGDDVATGGEFM